MDIPESVILRWFSQKSPEEREAILFILGQFLAAKELRSRLSDLEKLVKKV